MHVCLRACSGAAQSCLFSKHTRGSLRKPVRCPTLIRRASKTQASHWPARGGRQVRRWTLLMEVFYWWYLLLLWFCGLLCFGLGPVPFLAGNMQHPGGLHLPFCQRQLSLRRNLDEVKGQCASGSTSVLSGLWIRHGKCIWSQELDSSILVGRFQLRISHDRPKRWQGHHPGH